MGTGHAVICPIIIINDLATQPRNTNATTRIATQKLCKPQCTHTNRPVIIIPYGSYNLLYDRQPGEAKDPLEIERHSVCDTEATIA